MKNMLSKRFNKSIDIIKNNSKVQLRNVHSSNNLKINLQDEQKRVSRTSQTDRQKQYEIKADLEKRSKVKLDNYLKSRNKM